MSTKDTFFSIIIPAYNSENFIVKCLDSLLNQSIKLTDFEVIIVDDCSSDSTVEIVNNHLTRFPYIQVLSTASNLGPGIARNVGINAAHGRWLVFLDSDDELAEFALEKLRDAIKDFNDNVDAVGYNWRLIDITNTINQGKRDGRRDSQFIGNKSQTIKAYLECRMDHSVIYTSVKKDLIVKNNISFKEGIHEDVDFIFKVYFYAREVFYLNERIYNKRSHPESITHKVTNRHIDGIFRAWVDIKEFIALELTVPSDFDEYLKYFEHGSIGLIATRVREVVRHETETKNVYILFDNIYQKCRLLGTSFKSLNNNNTTYYKIVNSFITTMSDNKLSKDEKVFNIMNAVKYLDGKSWSCVDLHHSVFLRGDQVRTCCKRFFVNGEMKGDVPLFNVENGTTVTPVQILEAKQELHQKINSGVQSACDGCPFLEFREWGQINKLEIKYLSMEYHSVCNLKCTYCSDEYYGGKDAIYDISETLDQLIESGSLDTCALVVWGGGEPTIGKDFEHIVSKINEKIPSVQQRILTNSVKASDVVKKILKNNTGQVVTSIDAGNASTFHKIRGNNRLKDVCATLRDYSLLNAKKLTIKYIFTDGNYSKDEVSNFVSLMSSNNLLCCNFQISGDFKQEYFSVEIAYNMLLMYGLLIKEGCEVVYIDELVRHRIMKLMQVETSDCIEQLHNEVGIEFIATPSRYPEIVIWGAGQQAKYLLSNSKFIKDTNLICFVDSTLSKVGSNYLGYIVNDISFLLNNDFPFAIAAVQGYPLIVEQMTLMDIDKKRLIKDLII